MLDQIDALIEHRRQELRALEVAREALSSWNPPAVAAEPVTRPVPKRAAPARPKPVADRVDRRDRIRAIAGGSPTPPPVKGKRRVYTPEFKLKILDELAGGRQVCEVVREHQISSSLITYWKKQAAAGTLERQAIAVDDSTPTAFNDVVMTEGDDDEGGDLVDAMSGKEAVADDALPFGEEDGMPSGFARSSPRPQFRGRPRMGA